MSRRIMLAVLFMMLLGVESTPRTTTAQDACQSDDCQVFLPVVHTPQYARVVDWVPTTGAGRYCPNETPSFFEVTVASNTNIPIARVEVKGVLTEMYEGTHTFTGATTEPIFAGQTATILVQEDVGWGCLGFKPEGGFEITNIVLDPTLQQLQVKDVIVDGEPVPCGYYSGSTEVTVSGKLQNTTPFTLTQLRAHYRSDSGVYRFLDNDAAVQSTVLLPGATTTFSQTFTWDAYDPMAYCGEYGTATNPLSPISVSGWGTIAP